MDSPSKLRSGTLPPDCPKELPGLRILVVDDEEDARVLLASILEQCDAVVEAVSSAAAALERLRLFSFDVLLSDIAMPGEVGLTLMRKIRALPPEQGGRIAAVAITASARAEDRTRALRAGFNIHLPKPVEPAELLVAVSSVSGRLQG
jgi:CheY-like chemotaxis protein